MKKDKLQELGVTLMELLVTLTLFSIAGVITASFMMSSFRSLASSTRSTHSNLELSNALALLTTELRMARSGSPYIIGNSVEDATCTDEIEVNDFSLKFLVSHDSGDPAQPQGRQVYYVGYQFDQASNILFRGEVEASSSSPCTIPSGDDPLDSSRRRPLAVDVTPDFELDGAVEPVFTFDGNTVDVRLGALGDKNSGKPAISPHQLAIHLR